MVLVVLTTLSLPHQTLPSKVTAKKAAAGRKKLQPSSSHSFYGASSSSTRSPSPAGPSTPDIASGASTPTLTDTTEPSQEFQCPDARPVAPRSTVMTLLSKPHVRAVLSAGFMFSFLGVGTDVVFVLYSYTRVDLGGMGRSVRLASCRLSPDR